MGVPDDYAYQKRTEKSAKKEQAKSTPKSGNGSAGWSGGSDAAAAKAREIQAQQDAARQRALEEAYRRQQEAARKAREEAANKKPVESWSEYTAHKGAETKSIQAKEDEQLAQQPWKQALDKFFVDLGPSPEKQQARLDAMIGAGKARAGTAALPTSRPDTPMLGASRIGRAAPVGVGGLKGYSDLPTNSEYKAEKYDVWSDRIKYLTDAQLKATASDPGKITDAKQLDFDKMNVSDKGALMWNSMLDEALSGDRANLKKFGTDKNKDGVLQLSELKDDANIPKGYKAAYRSAFGNVDEDKIAFSPRVVGLLNTYGVDNVGLSLEQITKGAGYITDEDLVSNAKFKGDTGPAGHIDSRNEILTERLRPQLDEFTDMARNSQADVGGAKANLNLFDTTLEQRQSFVDSSALQLAQADEVLRALKLGGRGDYTSDRYGQNGVGQDLSSLVGQGTMNKLNTMQQLRASIEAAGGDLDLKTDTQQKLAYLKNYGISADDWTAFLKEVRSSEKKNKEDRTADELLGLKKEGS